MPHGRERGDSGSLRAGLELEAKCMVKGVKSIGRERGEAWETTSDERQD